MGTDPPPVYENLEYLRWINASAHHADYTDWLSLAGSAWCRFGKQLSACTSTSYLWLLKTAWRTKLAQNPVAAMAELHALPVRQVSVWSSQPNSCSVAFTKDGYWPVCALGPPTWMRTNTLRSGHITLIIFLPQRRGAEGLRKRISRRVPAPSVPVDAARLGHASAWRCRCRAGTP